MSTRCPIDAGSFVKGDEAARLLDGAEHVVGQARIDFGGDSSGNDGENFTAEAHQQMFESFGLQATAKALQGLAEQVLIACLLGCLQNEARIGGGVLRGEGTHGLKIARVGHHGREGFELV
jgi:hypothetical protein